MSVNESPRKKTNFVLAPQRTMVADSKTRQAYIINLKKPLKVPIGKKYSFLLKTIKTIYRVSELWLGIERRRKPCLEA